MGGAGDLLGRGSFQGGEPRSKGGGASFQGGGASFQGAKRVA